LLRKCSEQDPAADRSDIVDDRDQTDDVGRQLVLDLQKSWIDVLASMAVEIEGGHENDRINRKLPMRSQYLERATLRARHRPVEARRFRYVSADVEHEQRRNDTDHEHSAPADILKQNAIDDRSQEIARRIAGLQKTRNEAPRMRRNVSMVRDAPTPHSPPIAIP
jgi:hypothetical protein